MIGRERKRHIFNSVTSCLHESTSTKVRNYNYCLLELLATSKNKKNLGSRTSPNELICRNYSSQPNLRTYSLKMPNDEQLLEKCKILCETKKLDTEPFVQEIELLSEEERSLVRIGKVLGSGGFGCVHEGQYKGRQVAIKKFHVNSKSRRAMLQSFEAETSIMAFCHPNIIKTLASFGKDLQLGCRIIVMELAGNKTLRNIIDDDKDDICEERRIKFGFQVASALEFLHKSEIAHLDVKPANIVVDNSDVCKLGDFGCSQVIGEGDDDLPASPTCSYLTGTFAYRAPELLKGEAPTTKADMYSMGICLWQLLTREQPYGSENLYVVVFGVVAYNLRPPVPPAENQCIRKYDALVERLWQAEPSARPSAGETMETLRMLQLALHG